MGGDMISLLCQYRIRISCMVEDAGWDAFLQNVPGGHYTQSSAWAKVKSLLGWQTIRILVEENQRIVGGVQILMRPLPFLGFICYAPGGPLFEQDDPQVVQLLLNYLYQIIKKYRVQYMLIQPQQMQPLIEENLLNEGFQHTERHAITVSTLLLDLTQDTSQLLSSLRKSTRRNIRLGQRAGTIVREGTKDDLHVFYRIIKESCKRNNYHTFPRAYFTHLWDILHPQGYLHLFIAEYKGEAIATSLVISFGTTVTDTIGAWNGLYPKAYANELLEWTVMTWAKSQGYRTFDFDGFPVEMSTSEMLPSTLKEGGAFFKLGFGGHPVRYATAYEYFPNRVLRHLFSMLDENGYSKRALIGVERFVRGMSRD